MISICPKHFESKQQLVRVCMQPSCRMPQLLCTKCLNDDDIHQDHRTISIKKFLEDINGFQYIDLVYRQEGALQLTIKAEKIACLTQICQLRESSQAFLDDIEAKANQYYDKLDNTVKRLFIEYQNLRNIPFQIDLNKPLNQLILDFKEQKQLFFKKMNMDNETASNFTRIEQELKETMNMFKEGSKYVLNNLTLNFTGLKNILGDQFSYRIQPINLDLTLNSWSRKYKHSDLHINGFSLNRSKMSSNDTYGVYCLGTVDFDNRSLESYRCSFEITKMKQAMILGMCSANQAIEHQFVGWRLGHVGHGHYAVSSYCHIFSDIDSQVNGQKLGFSFKVGDIIKFQYIPSQSIVIFKKGVLKLQMDVQKSKGQQKYRLFVRLFDKLDEIKIIND